MAGLATAEGALYERMHANLVASWAEYADGTDGAALEHLPAAVAAIFPTGPERGVYNNAVLARGLRGRPTAAAIDAVEDAYDRSGIAGFAVWAHDSETDANAELKRRGYHVDTATRAMAMSLDDTSLPRPDVALAAGQWADYLALLTQFGAPDGLLAGVDGSRFEVLMALHDGRPAAAALAFDHHGDCGIYNVGTLPRARRCGLATALTALQLHNGRKRGCTTASLQATPMAERIYARVGFRDLGRFLEYVRGRP